MSKVLVVLGSTRDGRQGLRVARLIVQQLQAVGLAPTLIGKFKKSFDREIHSFTWASITDPLEYDAPLVRQPLHFMPPDQQANAPAWMTKLDAEIKSADGFVLVAPEYNATAPPALTNLLDHFAPGHYRHKPVSIATYSLGFMGGCRARIALLPFVGELGMVSEAERKVHGHVDFQLCLGVNCRSAFRRHWQCQALEALR